MVILFSTIRHRQRVPQCSRLGHTAKVIMLLIAVGVLIFCVTQLSFQQPPLKFSRETTFIESPRTSDGMPDFVAALNVEWSQDVTPENNAAVLLLEALGPATISNSTRAEYYQALEVEMPPLKGDYLVGESEFWKSQGIGPQRIKELSHLEFAPFTSEERPEVAAWIAASAGPAEKLTQAALREEFYTPILIPPDADLLLEVMLNEYQMSRTAVRLMSQRAMLRLGSGDIDGACEDAVTCLRLGRLIGTSPFLICNLVGIAHFSIGVRCCEQIILSGKLSAAAADKLQQQIEQLPASADIARSVDKGERMTILDSMIKLVDSDIETEYIEPLPWYVRGRIDLNVALPEINVEFDRIVEALSIEDSQKRNAEIQRLDHELQVRAARVSQSMEMSSQMILWGQRSVSRAIGEIYAIHLVPKFQSLQAAQDLAAIRTRLMLTGSTIGRYSSQTGTFPESLDQLIPDYLAEVPVELSGETPLKYLRHPDGFLLYRVGPNGIDDGGHQDSDPDQRSTSVDDIRFGRLPPE